ncbi:MAG: polyphosphate polymerase domain-containing protein [Clostridia bacterium]|nr:polyphosphate polymerase domain-containing protein [Clostridia bacterium]MBP5270593.1 polyphosphate polymerase domain-containing protein [Clostridia bacterium]
MIRVENPVVVMKRFELKYIITREQEDYFRQAIGGRMLPDRFGKTSIQSLYYDTPEYRLISASIENPLFKEKIRLRSYGIATDDSPVFLELKRKAYGIVYKRRVESTIPLVNKFFAKDGDICAGGQINSELVYFRDYYRDLAPACLIIYDRTAFFEPDGELRLTIDSCPRYRTDDMDIRHPVDGIPLLDPGCSVLEIKVQESMPLWLTEILSRGRIYKTSFSKVGAAYKMQMRSYN